jgi:predicted  nucleic acid-binding Zn-ribbon protein
LTYYSRWTTTRAEASSATINCPPSADGLVCGIAATVKYVKVTGQVRQKITSRCPDWGWQDYEMVSPVIKDVHHRVDDDGGEDQDGLDLDLDGGNDNNNNDDNNGSDDDEGNDHHTLDVDLSGDDDEDENDENAYEEEDEENNGDNVEIVFSGCYSDCRTMESCRTAIEEGLELCPTYEMPPFADQIHRETAQENLQEGIVISGPETVARRRAVPFRV